MSAAEFAEAFNQGRAAFAARLPVTANPYAPERVHVLDPPPELRRTALAAAWLRGWNRDIPEVVVPDD